MKKIASLMKKIVSLMKITISFLIIPVSLSFTQFANAEKATAVFAGGCFWCLEADFEKLPGVLAAESGYSGGGKADADYKKVSSGTTKHAESVRVTYDTDKVSYETLVNYFWKHIDPTVKDQQFCDHGPQYRSAIFYGSETELAIVNASKNLILKSGKISNIETEIVPASAFYSAEDYHQDYYKRNSVRYNFYRKGCGRDKRVNEIWGKAD
jgi:peptide-methionine (S)-S-oxide reductase